jgi:hypothetical protein
MKDGIWVSLRKYSYDNVEKINNKLIHKWYDLENKLLYDSGGVIPGYMNEKKQFIPVVMRDVELYRNKNYDSWGEYISELEKGKLESYWIEKTEEN